MEVRRKREIRSGEEFTPFFPKPNFRDSTINKDGDVEDTIRLIKNKVVPENVWQVEKIARKLKGRDLEETCSNIWHFVYQHVAYRKDKAGTEQVRSPARTWWERHEGVDCDCYTVFISTILTSLKIPHKYRITKYQKVPPEIPHWQHIYVVVPLSGELNEELEDQADYITLDCVKDEYDSEEMYLQKKDYSMKLDYLDGIDGSGDEEYVIPMSQDAQDLAATYDEEELGKIGNWAKKAVKSVAKVAKVAAMPITKPLTTSIKIIKNPKQAGKIIKQEVKQGTKDLKEGLHVINKLTNPGAILLRNGFLLAMKTNFMGIAKKLRFGYLSDEKAVPLGINLDKLRQLRKVREKAENIYWQAGGEKSNLAKAIIKGKGNKDQKVSLAGINDEVYADAEEYQILHSHYLMGFGELGEPATAASIAAATTVLTAIAAALKQIKGLFSGNPKAEEEFQSEEGAGSAADITSDYSNASEEQIVDDPLPEQAQTIVPPSYMLPQQQQVDTTSYQPYVAPMESKAASYAQMPQAAAFQQQEFQPQAEILPQSSSMLPQNTPSPSALLRQMDNSGGGGGGGGGGSGSSSAPEAETLPAISNPLLPVPVAAKEPWYKNNTTLAMGAVGIIALGFLAYKTMNKGKKGKADPALSGTDNKTKAKKKGGKQNITKVKFY